MPNSAQKLILEAMCEPKKISYIKFSDIHSDLILDELVNRWSDFRDVQLVIVHYDSLRYSRFSDGRSGNNINRKLLSKCIEKISLRGDQQLPPIPLLLEGVDDDGLSAELYYSQSSRSHLEQLNFFFLRNRDFPDLKTVEGIKNSLKSPPKKYLDDQLPLSLAGESNITTLKPASSSLDSEDSSILVSSASDSEDDAVEFSDEIKVVHYSMRDTASRSTQNGPKTFTELSDRRAPERKIKPEKSHFADKTRSHVQPGPSRSARTNYEKSAKSVMESTERKIEKRDRCVIS